MTSIVGTIDDSGQLHNIIPETMVDAALARTFIAGDTINPGSCVTKHTGDGLVYMSGGFHPPGVVAFAGFSAETVVRNAGETVIVAGFGIIRRDDWTSVSGTALLTQNAPYFVSQAGPGMITTVPPTVLPATVISRVGRSVSPNHLVIASFSAVLLRIAPSPGVPVWFDPLIGSFNPISGLQIPPLPVAPLVLTANAITITQGWHSVTTAAGTIAQRTLSNIGGGAAGQILILQKDATSPGDVIIGDNDVGGNIQSAGNFTLTNVRDKITFLYDGTFWCELSRSNNA